MSPTLHRERREHGARQTATWGRRDADPTFPKLPGQNAIVTGPAASSGIRPELGDVRIRRNRRVAGVRREIRFFDHVDDVVDAGPGQLLVQRILYRLGNADDDRFGAGRRVVAEPDAGVSSAAATSPGGGLAAAGKANASGRATPTTAAPSRNPRKTEVRSVMVSSPVCACPNASVPGGPLTAARAEQQVPAPLYYRNP